MHPIRLRGPWDYQPLSAASGDAANLPAAGRVRMPCDWAASLGSAFRGRVLYQRHFGCPTSLGPGDRVDLVFGAVRTAATARLNDRPLVDFSGPNGARIDVTSRLAERNLLEVVVEHLAGELAGGLVGEVRLEIFPADELKTE